MKRITDAELAERMAKQRIEKESKLNANELVGEFDAKEFKELGEKIVKVKVVKIK